MWRQQLLTFVEQFQHPAWGVPHCKRVYELSLQLAKLQNVDVDEDALFAAAYLHDIGAFEPYKQPDIDHAKRSVEVVDDILASINFPPDKVPLVKEIIQGHMFYARPTAQVEAVIFHDADTLDFMGTVGITRLLSIVGLDDWTPDLDSAIELIRRFSQYLPNKLLTPEAQEIAQERQAEMEAYLSALSNETNGFEIL